MISGDITDSGDKAEWEQAGRLLLEPAKTAGVDIVLAPGNHDLQPAMLRHLNRPVDFGEAGLLFDYFHAQKRWGASMRTADRQTLKILLKAYGRVGERYAEYEEKLSLCVRGEFVTRQYGNSAAGLEARIICEKKMSTDAEPMNRELFSLKKWFPLIYENRRSSTTVIVLSSNFETTYSIGSVGIGTYGEGQLKRLKSSLARIPAWTRYVLVMTHHPPLRRHDERFRLPKPLWSIKAWEDSSLWNFALLRHRSHEARELLEIVSEAAQKRPGRKILLLCGHRHGMYIAQATGGMGHLEAPALGSSDRFLSGYESADSTGLHWGWSAVAER